MFTKKLTALLFLFTALFFFNANAQDDSEPTTASSVANAHLPWGAQRLLPGKIPAEFNEVFEKMLAEGEGKITGGNREVLAWEGNYKNKSNAAKIKGELQINFRKEGWQYETSGSKGEVEFFSLVQEDSPRRVVLGFFVSGDDVIVCALMEVKRAEAVPSEISNQSPNNSDRSIVGKWFRTMGGSTISSTGKTTLKGGEYFTFQFSADGTVEYTRKKEIINWMQCHINSTDNARGRYSLSGNSLTINLGAMKSIGSNSCNAKENYNKTLGNSTLTVKFEIKQMDDISRPDKPTIMCFDGNEVCYEKQR